MARKNRRQSDRKTAAAEPARAADVAFSIRNLPKVLHGHAEALIGALATALLAEWPEGEEFAEAEQAGAIGDVLIPPIYNEIATAKIAYLFKEKMGSGERIDLGKAKRTSGLLAHLTAYDFVLVFNWTAWKACTPIQRLALVDHELAHCGRGDDGQWTILHHEVEEFAGVVRRWGLWTSDLRMSWR